MIDKVLIAGAGQVGSEIGFQCAVHGLNVVMFDVAQSSLDQSRTSHAEYSAMFKSKGLLRNGDDTGKVLSRITYESDPPAACADVDLVSESVTESLEIKQSLYEALDQHCPPHTIFTTNTSTMLASELGALTHRPDRFLACHVGRPVWEVGMLEIMPHAATDPSVTDQVVAFATRVGLTPIFLNKEQAGYISNSLIVPFVISSLDLVSRGVASFEDVDRVWMLGTGAPIGPIGMIDLMGIPTVHAALSHLADKGGKPELVPITAYLKGELLDHGKLGVRSGNGFYSYPDPAFYEDHATGERSGNGRVKSGMGVVHAPGCRFMSDSEIILRSMPPLPSRPFKARPSSGRQ